MSKSLPIALACLTILAPSIHAQGEAPDPPVGLGRAVKTLEGERAIRGRIDAFFKQIIAGETSEAFAGLMEGSPLGMRKKAIDDLVADTAKIVESYGAIRSYEALRISRLGSRMIRITYLSYSDDYPLKWEIYCFLGTKSGWQILDLAVNNSFTELFDDPSVRRLGGTTP